MFAKVNSVAFVDDDESVRLSNSQSLELAGLTVHPFACAGDALKVLDDKFPGVVVSDISMPQMDGRAFFSRLSEIDGSLPVIFITAFPERLLTGERPEPTFLVTKPFNPDMVKALISQALFFDEGSRAAA